MPLTKKRCRKGYTTTMGTVDVIMTADLMEMAMVVFSDAPSPVPITMVPLTILRRIIITGYWSLRRYSRLLNQSFQKNTA